MLLARSRSRTLTLFSGSVTRRMCATSVDEKMKEMLTNELMASNVKVTVGPAYNTNTLVKTI